MVNKRYTNFFDEIKKFKEKQQKQKERGLNDYNLLTAVLNEHDEVRLHSRVIGSLLDINGLHYQSELFLEKFLEILEVDDFKYDIKNSKLMLEYQNIDLYLTDGTKHIIIENKIYAGDQDSQINRYYNIIKNENSHLEYNDILIVYLSIDRDKPSQYSLGKLTSDLNLVYHNSEKISYFKNINYNNEILGWLDKCIHEVQNITNLNESIKQYKYVVEKITNKYKEKVMPLKDFLLEENNLKLAMELEDSIVESKAEVQHHFWKELYIQLNQISSGFEFTDDRATPIDINNSSRVKEYYTNNKRYFGITKKLLDIDESYSLLFYIELDWNIVYGLSIAEKNIRKNICKNSKFDSISNQINKIENINWNLNSSWWIGWTYPKKRLDFYHFQDDIIFDLINKEKRIQIVKNLVEELMIAIDAITKEKNHDTI